ncbi:polyprenyl synthetase family protein [Nocardia sp. NBC_00565]|uniref:polyprenyl synthetase family protein n=1 Tax=Nocardia sp. NBC_00565 TaxID=2975993 RepID=UPI002E814453|nr:polyprenyl synthetase family protein [Nocardia sp. NBC_00565]WUC00879.1 polyprenyl synthetase family protein [Nocardia sp. NBC_00565]
MPREIDSAVFPHLDADLDRVRDVLGPVQFQGRPELTALTDEGPDSSRRLVRPTLTLLSYYLLADPAAPAEDRVVRAAAAMELLHLGSLYHDDVIDHAYQRRGRPNANAVWGSHMAVLGGDSVTSSGTRMLAELGQREVLVGAIAGEQMCEGMVIEAADLYAASRSEQSYLDSINGKTAVLLSLACQVGAMQAGRPEDQEEALALFGRHFGLAYQLYDDILDLTSTAEEMGKPVNTDLPEGIYTLPVIRAAARDRDLARLLRRAMTREQAAHARELVIASGAVDEAQAMADEFMDQAAGQLANLPADPHARHAMTAYARSILDRRTPLPVVPPQATQPPAAQSDALPPELARWVRSWMADTGLVVSPAEFDHHHRWSGALRSPAAQILAPADAAREQTTAAIAMLSFVWDDLFEDPQLRDPEAVTALRRGLVAMLRQDPEAAGRPGAIPTAWASLWPRLREGRTTRWQERFLDSLEEWFEAAEREAHHRIDGYIPATADYLPLRMSTSGIDIVLACIEVHQDRELPSKLRSHPVIRRLEELTFLVTFVENDLVGLDQDEADQIPYNLVRAVRHETGCTRREAVEQVQRQAAEHRAQLEAVIRYLPALLRMVPGLSGPRKEFASIYGNLANMTFWANQTDRYTPTASAAPDLERLRREIYHYPAAEPAPTAR